MDLVPEYKRAKQWVQDSLDFDKDAQFNTFEVSPSCLVVMYRCEG
jgi:hypothetical protein